MRAPHAAVAALVCLAVAGCASIGQPHATPSQQSTASIASSPAPSATGNTISTAAYLAKANAICAAGMRRSAALGSGPGDPTHATASQLPLFAAYLTDQSSALSDELKQLRALPLPADGVPGADTAYAHVAAALAHLNVAIAAARAGNLHSYQAAISDVSTETDAANHAAVAAGLTVCGS